MKWQNRFWFKDWVGISEDDLNARHKYIRRLENGHLAITIEYQIRSGKQDILKCNP